MTSFDVNKNKKLFLSPNQVLKRGNNKLNLSSFHLKIKRAATNIRFNCSRNSNFDFFLDIECEFIILFF